MHISSEIFNGILFCFLNTEVFYISGVEKKTIMHMCKSAKRIRALLNLSN